MTEPLSDILLRRKFSSYRKIRKFLQSNIIKLNGIRITNPETPVNLFKDKLVQNDSILNLPPDIYIMLNKKAGTICSNSSCTNSNINNFPLVFETFPETLYDKTLIPTPLHTIGRLDADTTGLLLITTNGDFSHKLSLPEFHINKTYQITLETPCSLQLQKEYIQKCKEGIFCPQKHSSPAFTAQSAELIFNSETICMLTIHEGKFRQVKRMIEQLGNKVIQLKRISIGALKLDQKLSEGEWRFLTEHELMFFN